MDYDETYADRRADEVTSTGHQWVKQAQKLYGMGHTISDGAVPTVAGQAITSAALLRQAEQLAENVKATLEAVEKQPEQNRKLVGQWRFALNCFFGAVHKKGLIPDLKDGGPDAY